MMKGITPILIFAVGFLLIVGLLAFTGEGLIGIANLVASYTGFPVASGVSGWTTLGLSQANFKTSSQLPDGSFWNNPLWIMTVVQGGQGQYAEGIITPRNLEQESGHASTQNFEIKAAFSRQSCEYPIEKMPYPVALRDFFIKEWGNFLTACTSSDADINCGAGQWVTYGRYNAGSGCFCIKASNIASEIDDSLNAIGARTTATITVSNELKEDKFNIDTFGQSRGFVNDNVYVVWNGDLLKAYCPSMSDYYAYYSNGWHIGSLPAYKSYRDIASNDAVQTYTAGIVGRSDAKEQIISRLNTIRTWRERALSVVSQPIESGFYLDGAKISKPLNAWSNAGLYTFYVKADYLTIVQPIADVYIQSVSSAPFRTNGKVLSVLSNIGDAGNIRIWYSCSSPFTSAYEAEYGIGKGETSQYELPISASCSSPVSATCTLYVNDVTHTRSKTFTATCNPEAVCTPSEKTCTSDNKIQQCNQWGSGQNIIEDCAAKGQVCRYVGNQPVCVNKDVVPPPCDFICQIGKYIGMFIVAAIISAILIVVLFFIPFTRGFVMFINPLLIWLIAVIALMLLFGATIASLAAVLI